MKIYKFFRIILLFHIVASVGCRVQLVTPYDPVIENGIIEFKENINLFVKKMVIQGGTEAGEYENNRETYAELETSLDILIDRAAIKSTGACQLATKQSEKLNDLLNNQIEKLKDKLPGASAQLDAMRTQINAQTISSGEGNSYGCSERLLLLVKNQLMLLQDLHKVPSCSSPPVSCLNQSEADQAIALINISINAVWVVEEAKKNAK
jgi:hypothetical protein